MQNTALWCVKISKMDNSKKMGKLKIIYTLQIFIGMLQLQLKIFLLSSLECVVIIIKNDKINYVISVILLYKNFNPLKCEF